MSEHLYTFINPPNEKHLAKIAYALQSNGVIALPMGTNWVFCCDPNSRKALDQIRLLKPKHPEDRPFSIICSDISMVSTMGQVNNRNYNMLRKIFPGPYTAILPSHPNLPKRLDDKRRTVGIRIPNEQITLDIIRHYNNPLVATSIPDESEGVPMQMGYQVFDKYGHGLEMVVDLGQELPGTETTIFDFTGEEVVLVRAGAGDIDIFS